MPRKRIRPTKELRFSLGHGDELQLRDPLGRRRRRLSIRLPRECLLRIVKSPKKRKS